MVVLPRTILAVSSAVTLLAGIAACADRSPMKVSRWLLVLAVLMAVAAVVRLRSRPKDALMELAGVLRDAPVPPDLVDRAAKIAARRAAAKVPASQEEQLAALLTDPAPRFAVDDREKWMEFLDREGFVVIADVAGPRDLERAEELLWKFLEDKTPWRRSSPDTWTDRGFQDIGCVHRGLLNGGGMGQSAFLWHLRTLPRVRMAFETIWKTQELLVSFDGANIFRPWHHGFQKTRCGWWHVDQGAAKQGRHAVQGFVSLYEASLETGGFTVVPGSHLRHNEVVADQANPSVDYCTVQPYEPVMQELPQRLVCCQAGDLVLWDSRAVHANSPAPRQPTAPRDRLLRAVGYVCMTPKSFAPSDVRTKRRTAYEHGFSTSHWPHKLDLGDHGEGPLVPLSQAPQEVQDLVG
mmetsp:Transcript_41574/g.115672  ORF Transcript_41574/g.115672 Transcript_41574/m.115672 type:complete len:408 (-) Transcript_41574:149-1372(-)|eukprot:CAMPEP_0179046936 /NCGR_PEP_ID=MMETSP0796-20121207/18942_1 /TAXON_ID=73915 /ORGANISM="Pyrodinium bahamense, Strain pbaha01" /LENGTH=407 /DNA_ID=CAMNT_0020743373 /DNA_START=61 /DNA_END=1284 /DNA_ORIENTATION=-